METTCEFDVMRVLLGGMALATSVSVSPLLVYSTKEEANADE